MPENSMNPIVANFNSAQRTANSNNLWTGFFTGRGPGREPVKSAESPVHAIHNASSEAARAQGPSNPKLRRELSGGPSETSYLVQGGGSPKRLPDRAPINASRAVEPSANRKLHTEGVPLTNTDYLDTQPYVRDGAPRGGERNPGKFLGSRGRGAGHGVPVVQKPNIEGVALTNFDSQFPALGGAPREAKPPPPPGPPKERGMGQGKTHHGASPVAKKPENEWAPSMTSNSPRPQTPVQGGVQYEGKKTLGPSKEQSTERGQKRHEISPVVKKPDNEGVSLMSSNFPRPRISTQGGVHYEGRQTPGPSKEQSAERGQKRHEISPVVKKPDNEGVSLTSSESPRPRISTQGSVQDEGKKTLGPSKEQSTERGQKRHEISPVVKKPDNEGVSLTSSDSPRPQIPAQDGVTRESKQPPPLHRPPGLPDVRDRSQEHGHHGPPPASQKLNVKTELLINFDSPDPQPPAQGVIQHEEKQTPELSKGQGTEREQGRSATPTIGPNQERESRAPTNIDPVDPQPQAKDSASRDSKRQPRLQKVQSWGRGGRGGGGGGRYKNRDSPVDRDHDNESGTPIKVDLPDPQPAVLDGTSRDVRPPLGQRGRDTSQAKRGGRTINPQERVVNQKPDNEVVRRDSLDSTIPKDTKSKGDSSQSKDGVNSKRSTMPAVSKRQAEPTKRSDEYTQLMGEFTKLSKAHTRFSEESVQTTAQFEVRVTELDAILREKDNQILELTEAISRMHQRDVEITKDDNYFATQFSDIASSIMQWVLTNFPRDVGKNYEVSLLPSPLRQFIRMSIASNDEHHFRSRDTRVRVISAVVAEVLYRHVFFYGSYFLPGSPETTEALQFLSTELQGNALQLQRWRALTISLLSKGHNFEIDFAEHVSVVTETLNNMLWVLVPQESDTGRRETGLRELVDRAARLSVEIRKQSDNIYLEPVVPGSPYSSKNMEDMSCLLEDDELVDATVQIQIFPAVLRRSCDPDGNSCSQAGVVMKARVIAVNPFIDAM